MNFSITPSFVQRTIVGSAYPQFAMDVFAVFLLIYFQVHVKYFDYTTLQITTTGMLLFFCRNLHTFSLATLAFVYLVCCFDENHNRCDDVYVCAYVYECAFPLTQSWWLTVTCESLVRPFALSLSQLLSGIYSCPESLLLRGSFSHDNLETALSAVNHVLYSIA